MKKKDLTWTTTASQSNGLVSMVTTKSEFFLSVPGFPVLLFSLIRGLLADMLTLSDCDKCCCGSQTSAGKLVFPQGISNICQIMYMTESFLLLFQLFGSFWKLFCIFYSNFTVCGTSGIRAVFLTGVVDDVNPLWTEENDGPKLRKDRGRQLARVRDIFHPSVIPEWCFSQRNEKRVQIHVSLCSLSTQRLKPSVHLWFQPFFPVHFNNVSILFIF